MHASAAVFSLALAVPACAGSGPPPTLEEIRSASYRGLEAPDEPIILQDGTWEGPRDRVTWMRGAFVTGDLDGAPGEEAAVILTRTGLGSGAFSYLAAMRRSGGRLENVSTILIGDRIEVRALRIRESRVEADLVQAGPSDAAC